MANATGGKLSAGVASANSLFHKYKGRATRAGITFSLTREQFVELTSKNCSYCGVEPKQNHRSHSGYNGDYIYNGIDRVDNNIGYVLSNSIPCCKVCNYMKRSTSQEDFIAHIKSIILYFKG